MIIVKLINLKDAKTRMDDDRKEIKVRKLKNITEWNCFNDFGRGVIKSWVAFLKDIIFLIFQLLYLVWNKVQSSI